MWKVAGKYYLQIFLAVIIALSALIIPLYTEPAKAGETIHYTASMDTNIEKLEAVYSLIRQVREESNKRVKLLPEEKVTGYIENYSKPALKLLLKERNLLQEAIIKEYMTIKEWGELQLADPVASRLVYFGNKYTLETQPTAATSELLDNLKSLKDDDIKPLTIIDPTEDFTTYTELDAGGYFTVTADNVTFTNLPLGTNNHYIYDDKGANHFDGDFTHRIETMLTATTSSGEESGVWMISNTIGDIIDNYNYAHNILFWYDSTRFVLRERTGSWQDLTASLSLNTLYYLEIERDEGVGSYGHTYAYIATGDYYGDGGSLVDTLDVTLQYSKVDYRYIYCAASNPNGSGGSMSGWNRYLDLQEGGGVVAPTLDTMASSLVEETTCNGTANVTATGGENLDYQGFEYGTYAGGTYTDNVTNSGNFSTGTYSLQISSLSEGTAYYVRGIGHNSAGWGYASDNDTILTKPLPASNFRSTDNGTTWLYLEWTNGTGADNVGIRYATGSAPSDNVSGTQGFYGAGTSANITGLSSNTTYFFRIDTYAVEAGLISKADTDVECQDTTDAAPVISAPTVTTSAATSVEETTATLNGNITSTGGEDCTQWVMYDTDLSSPYSDNQSNAGTHGTGAFGVDVTGLNKGDKYVFIASANNSAGFGYGSELYFMTKPDPATSFVSTDNGTTWISLSWTNGDGMDLVGIRYSDTSYPTDNTTGTAGFWGNDTTANITGLDENTTYYFSIFTYALEDGTFSIADTYDTATDTTDIAAPTMQTNAATSVTDTTATLNGQVTDNGGSNPDVYFFYGTSDGGTDPGSWSDNVSMGAQGGSFNTPLSGLSDNTTYYFTVRGINAGGTGWGSTANFTTSVTSPPSGIMPPPTLTLTDLGAITINGEWTASSNATYYMIRVSREDYPDSVTSGELAYYGTALTENWTGYNIDINTFYFSAWGYDSDNTTYSATYTTASIGGDGMEDLALNLGSLSTFLGDVSTTLGGILYFVPLLIISLIAFWKENYILFMLAAGISMVTGLYAPDIIDGSFETSMLGVTIGLTLVTYSLLCLAWSLRLIFWKEEAA